MRATRAIAIAVSAAFLGAAGCSLVIDGTVISVHCDAEGAYGPPACPAHQACTHGLCAPSDASAPTLGSGCTTSSDCSEGDFCLDPSEFGGKGDAMCSRPCCSSDDCNPSHEFVCWPPEKGGGNFCMASSSLGRDMTGKEEPGGHCSTGDDCRSALCEDERCSDPCCSDTNCAATGDVCQLGETGSARTWQCAEHPPDLEIYAKCKNDSDCTSRLCLTIGGELRCSIPCCSSSACGNFVDKDGVQNVACDDVPHETTLVRACSMVVPKKAIKAVGEPCTTDDECRSAKCVIGDGGADYCGDVCCNDASCGDPSTFVCRPAEAGAPIDSWVLRCRRK